MTSSRPAWGSFRTRGRRVAADDSWIVADHAYVQFHGPERPGDEVPILFVHGGGLSGSMWERTPDGRPGWAPRATALGRRAFVIDLVDAGRSGEAPPRERDGEREFKTARQIWERYRLGRAEDWPGPSSLPGSRFPFEHLDVLVAAHVPRRRSTDGPQLEALVEAIETIGPCDVIAHSHGATLAAHAVGRSPIRSLALIEPLPFDGVAGDGPRTVLVRGDFLSQSPIWAPAVDAYAAAPAVHLDLPAAGISGNTHVPMCDRNSDDVLDVILDRLTR